MPTARKLIAGLALALTAVSCTQDKSPTAPSDQAPPNTPALKPTQTGAITYAFNAVAVTDPTLGAGTFTGLLSITSFSTNSAGDLFANGTLTGVATFAGGVTKTLTAATGGFTNLLVDPQDCPILHLDVGPIFLDLLGLQISTNEIVLDITAVAGPGNLLGNLLCALVHLLDQNPLSALVGQLLNQINAILAGL